MTFLSQPKTVSIIGVPLALGQNLDGVDVAPTFLRQAGLEQVIRALGWGYEDLGDIFPDIPESVPLDWAYKTGVKFPVEVGQACQLLSERVAAAGRQGHFSLILGGDHSIALGSISGVLQAWPDAAVIWVDAHGDFNTPETSPSGHLHGMPLAGLMGYFKPGSPAGFDWLKPGLTSDRVALIGIRSLDSGERALLRDSGIKVFTMTEVDRYGIGRVMEMALEYTNSRGNRPFHLSLDIDGLDPHIAPSTGTRVRGGLTYREGHYIAETMAETGKLVSMDLVEINPQLSQLFSGTDMSDESQLDQTVGLGIEIIESALGKRIF